MGGDIKSKGKLFPRALSLGEGFAALEISRRERGRKEAKVLLGFGEAF